jgi:hypothetical protein
METVKLVKCVYQRAALMATADSILNYKGSDVEDVQGMVLQTLTKIMEDDLTVRDEIEETVMKSAADFAIRKLFSDKNDPKEADSKEADPK